MDITANFQFVNWFAVLAATVVAFVLAGLWFSPAMFGRVSGVVAEEPANGRNMQAIFVLAYILLWLSASLMAAVLGPNSTWSYGLTVGLLVGCFFVTPAIGITGIFDNKPIRHSVVAGGYHIVSFGLMGTIIGAWH